jgi:hypothetical protein
MVLEPITAERACAIADDLEGITNTLHDFVVPRGMCSREVRHASMATEHARRAVDNLATLLAAQETLLMTTTSATSNYRGEEA